MQQKKQNIAQSQLTTKNTKWIDTGLNENWKTHPLIKTVAILKYLKCLQFFYI